MAQTIVFYEERAAEAADEARTASLQNVKDRALRSEAAWRKMADRARAVQVQRDARNEVREATGEEQSHGSD